MMVACESAAYCKPNPPQGISPFAELGGVMLGLTQRFAQSVATVCNHVHGGKSWTSNDTDGVLVFVLRGMALGIDPVCAMHIGAIVACRVAVRKDGAGRPEGE